MPRILNLPYGVPFPVWTPDNFSGLISVVLWLCQAQLKLASSLNWGDGRVKVEIKAIIARPTELELD